MISAVAQALPALFTLIQGSYRFLDSKFKTFSRLFSTTIISFFRLKVIKSVINRGMNKAFLYDVLKQKNAQKNSRLFFIIFPDFISIFQTFFEVLKIARQISRLFLKTSRLCTNPIKTVFHDVYWASFSLWTPPQSLLLI